MAKIEEIVLVVGQEASTSTSSSTTNNTSIAVDTITIERPEILVPADGQTDFNGPIKSSEYKTSEYFYGEHQATDWEVSTDPNFSTVDISSYNDTVNLTSFRLVGLKSATTYYARVRYRSDNHISEWSKPVKFKTSSVIVETPRITIQGEPDNVPEMPIITCSEFTVIGGEDTHQSTDWVIKDINGNIVWSSLQDTVNLTSIRVPNNVLKPSTTYIFEVTYYGLKYNAVGSKTATTADIFGSIFDIFGDGSCIALFELNGNADDTGGIYNAEESNTSYDDGVLGLAVDYRNKGTNSYIKTPVIDRGGSKEITISGWIKVDRYIRKWINVWHLNPDDNYSINGNSRQPALFLYYYDNTRFHIRNDGIKNANLGISKSNGHVTYGKWAHIVLIVTLRQMKFYINKELTDIYNSNQDFKFNNGVFYIGDPWYSKNFMMDQVRIFNRALTDEEIEILYNEGM